MKCKDKMANFSLEGFRPDMTQKEKNGLKELCIDCYWKKIIFRTV